MNAAGKWIDAVPIEGTFVLKCVLPFITSASPEFSRFIHSYSLGDQFARWTSGFSEIISFQYLHPVADDVFKSTVHRAINKSGLERYSIPLFFGTDYDVKLEVSIPLHHVSLSPRPTQLRL